MMTMIFDWQLLFINSLFIFGWNYALGSPTIDQDDQIIVHPAIFGFITKFITKRFHSILIYPMFLCPVCMASLYGTLFYLLFTPTYNFIGWSVYIVALAGLNRILKGFCQ